MFLSIPAIAYDKGKPVARQGRKAVNLHSFRHLFWRADHGDCLVAEGDRRSHCFKLNSERLPFGSELTSASV